MIVPCNECGRTYEREANKGCPYCAVAKAKAREASAPQARRASRVSRTRSDLGAYSGPISSEVGRYYRKAIETSVSKYDKEEFRRRYKEQNSAEDLRYMLRMIGLDAKGNKAELLERVVAFAYPEPDPAPEPDPTPEPREKESAMSPMSAVMQAVPAGHVVKHGVTPDNKDVAVVMRGNKVVTVLDPHGDIPKQVSEDTCEKHRAFCCDRCMGAVV